jgi:hypothetical protein
MVTGLEAAYTRSDLEDDASALVPPDDREEAAFRLLGEFLNLLPGPDVAPTQVLVGVTQAGGFPLDQNLLLLRRIQIDFLDLPVLPTTEEDSSVRFHLDTP